MFSALIFILKHGTVTGIIPGYDSKISNHRRPKISSCQYCRYGKALKRVYLYAVIYDSIRTQKTTIDSKKCFSKEGPGVFDLFDREKSETTY